MHLRYILYWVILQVVLYYVIGLLMAVKWSWTTGHPFTSSVGIVFKSEVQILELMPTYITVAIVTSVCWLIYLMLPYLHLSIGW